MTRLRDMLGNFRETRRYHGARATLRASLKSRFSRDRRTLYLFGLTHPLALRPPEDLRLDRHFATRADLARLIASGEQKPDTLDLLERGDACLLQFVDGRLAGCAWLSTRNEVELMSGLFLTISGESAYAFRTWTVPEMRGHGLQPLRALDMLEESRRRHRRRLLCFVDSTNLASLKGVVKAGYERVGTLCWTKLARNPGHARLQIESPEWDQLSVRVEGQSAPRLAALAPCP